MMLFPSASDVLLISIDLISTSFSVKYVFSFSVC